VGDRQCQDLPAHLPQPQSFPLWAYKPIRKYNGITLCYKPCFLDNLPETLDAAKKQLANLLRIPEVPS
jgi:hypothetical protein